MTRPIPFGATMIVTRALARTFKGQGGTVEAVRGVDLRVGAGEIFGFLGPNGAGKTTTLRMLATLITPTAGEATVAGADLRREPQEVRRRIAADAARALFNGDWSNPEVAIGATIMDALAVFAVWLAARAFGRAVA